MGSFKTGDRVKCVVSTPWYSDGADFGGDDYKGKTGTVTDDGLSPGEVSISWDDGGWDYLSEQCLELIEPDGTSVSADSPVTHLEVRVQTRFFIGDVDITDTIKGLIKG